MQLLNCAPFEATFVLVTDLVVSASEYQFRDSQLRFYTEIMHFTAEEVNQGMRNAMQHFNSQFSLDFSNVGPDDTNQRFLRNEAFGLYRVPFNETIVTNHWIVTGNRKSTCFPMSRVYNSSIAQQCYMGCIVVKQDDQLLQTIICYMAILWFLVPVLSSQF